MQKKGLVISSQELSDIFSNPCVMPGLEELYRWSSDLTFSQSPSFDPSSIWFVIGDDRPVSGRRQRVRKLVYQKQREDNDKYDIDISEAILDPEEWDAVFNRIIDVSIIPFPSNPVFGFDGETFRMEVRKFRISFEWWCDGEEVNREMIDIALGIRGWLEGRIDAVLA